MCITILKEALGTVTPEVWDRSVRKVESNIYQDYFSQVPLNSLTIKPFIITIGPEDDEDDGLDDENFYKKIMVQKQKT